MRLPQYLLFIVYYVHSATALTIQFDVGASSSSFFTLTLNASTGSLVASDPEFSPSSAGTIGGTTSGSTFAVSITGIGNVDGTSPFDPDTWTGGDDSQSIALQTQGLGIVGDSNNNVQRGEAFVLEFDLSSLAANDTVYLTGTGFNIDFFEVYKRNVSVPIGTSGAGDKISGTPASSFTFNEEVQTDDQFLIYGTVGSNGPRWTSLSLEVVSIEPIIPEIQSIFMLEGGKQLRFDWTSSFGQQFDITKSETLEPTDWVLDVESLPASANGTTSYTVDTTSSPSAEFYKVQLKEERIPLPNVILLFADDLGYGDLACYGHPYAKTPNLDRLAAQGTQFMKFNVTGATCNPSRTGLLTSWLPQAYPLNTGTSGFKQAEFGYFDRVTVTELLKSAGYTTALIGKWHIGKPEPTDAFYEPYGLDYVSIRGGGGKALRGRDEGIYEEAIEFIEANYEEPFYLNVMGRVTHNPVDPRPELVVSAGFSDLVVDRDEFKGSQIQGMFDRVETATVGDQSIHTSMANYLTEVYYLDQFIGELLDKLDELGIADNTIVMFSSDQGAAPVGPSVERETNLVGYSGGLRGQKHTQYEGGLRSPCIMRWPGFIPAGKVNTESIFSALDWLPTLCRIADVPIDSNEFHGEDVLDIWMGSDRSRNGPQFWKNSLKYLNDNGEWRCYFQNNSQTPIELYNLSIDIAETNNLLDEEPELVEQLIEIWEAWTATLPE